MTASTVEFTDPRDPPPDGVHHAAARAGNDAVADAASATLAAVLEGDEPYERLLLKAAAGAGKSYILKRLVEEAVAHDNTSRVAVVAFTNKQTQPLAADLGEALGRDRVCLFVAKDRIGDVPADVSERATVVASTKDIPDSRVVIVATCHKLGAYGGERQRQLDRFGPGVNGNDPFDVLFVDEAWQVAHHVFRRVAKAAPIWVGVGDVGQLPPIEVGTNPWRGDPGHNPWRAWPTDYEDDPLTWSAELPAVYRPAAGHLGLWRAFYPDWDELHCVAAPADRWAEFGAMPATSAAVWAQVATGVPTLLEIDGLLPADAADIDLPLVECVAALLDDAFAAGFTLSRTDYGDDGNPNGVVHTQSPGEAGNPLVAILATRNQAVDDAADAVDRLRDKHGLTENDLLASTVDSWQGQTNGFTVAIHPLTGAARLDEFNSAFGRLAVTCTRATHGLLLVSRPGLGDLLREAPARPGTPFGEPGIRQLPRQTHERILASFVRGRLTVTPDEDRH